MQTQNKHTNTFIALIFERGQGERKSRIFISPRISRIVRIVRPIVIANALEIPLFLKENEKKKKKKTLSFFICLFMRTIRYEYDRFCYNCTHRHRFEMGTKFKCKNAPIAFVIPRKP